VTERDDAARRVFAPTMWAALERFERKRDAQHFGYNALPEDPGTVHALPGGRLFRLPRPEFMGGEGPRALCGDRVLVRLPVAFDDGDPDACAECCELLARGVTRAPGGGVGRRFDCRAVVTPDAADAAAYGCALREGHRGPHRAAGGETWETGPEDFTPAPDGFV
jgi:hypothetical protein